MAGRAHQLGAGVVGPAELDEPLGPAAQDLRRHGDGLDVVDGRGAAINAGAGRERGLQPRLALLALEALQQRHLVAADVGAAAVGDADVAVPAQLGVLADQTGRRGLDDRRLQPLAFQHIFAADVDEAVVRPDRPARHQAPLDQAVRVEPHDLAVLAGARLRLVGVDHQVVRPLAFLLGHEGPLQACGEARAATAAQAGVLDLLAEPLGLHGQHLGGAVPDAALLRPLQTPVVEPVQVGEDAILVFQNADHA